MNYIPDSDMCKAIASHIINDDDYDMYDNESSAEFPQVTISVVLVTTVIVWLDYHSFSYS